MRIFNYFLIVIILVSSCKEETEESPILSNDYGTGLYIATDNGVSFFDGDTAIISNKYFTEDVVVVTSEGNLVGVEAVKNFYLNYFTGFSEIEFTIVDAFGQGDKIMKYWNFKGIHTGNFFGIPPSGNKLDLSGTTLVKIKDGRVTSEQDFFDMKSMLDQLMQTSGDVVVDAQTQGVL